MKISQFGKTLNKSKYTIDKKAKTFSTTENNLVIDASECEGWTFKTGSYCTFKTGSYCTFKTGSYCTFKTGFATYKCEICDKIIKIGDYEFGLNRITEFEKDILIPIAQDAMMEFYCKRCGDELKKTLKKTLMKLKEKRKR
jgi:hypothetical protein